MEDRTAAGDRHCRECIYCCILSGYVCCEYILVTGARRGCKAGLGCTRYIKGSPKQRGRLKGTPKPVEPQAPRPKKRPGPKLQPDVCWVDVERMEELRTRCGALNNAEKLLGMPRGTLNMAKHNGRLNIRHVERIKQEYGIDVRRSEQ